MEAIADLLANYCHAVMYYARWYEELFGGDGPDGGPGWVGPDDDYAWILCDSGEGPLPKSALPEGATLGEADLARWVGDGAA